MDKQEFDIVRKLWSLCDILRDDGVTYQNYVTELTFILFLKMLEEKDLEKRLPKEFRWKLLASKDGIELMNYYRQMLLDLGNAEKTKDKLVRSIYENANTTIRQPKHLSKIVATIDKLDWHSDKRDQLGDLYEGLLEKNAGEKKSGAGQYFTPRKLIDCMVRLMKPQPGELIQDPAAGTGGFIIAADHYIKEHTKQLFDLSSDQQEFQIHNAFYGAELVPETHRLALMNLMLHDIDAGLGCEDTMSPYGAGLKPATLILTNPPFGTKQGGGRPTRDDFTFDTSNKQLNFLQHIYRNIAPGGRAAVVLPDNILFEEGQGTNIRKDLLNKCNLHTILRLPTGIFYAQGVKTNVLFFTKGKKKDIENTKSVWVYDLRTNMPPFGKTAQLTSVHFEEFESCYGDDPHGGSKRKEKERFKQFSIEEIEKRKWNLDIRWLKDESSGHYEDLPDPDELILEAKGELEEVMASLNQILESLPTYEVSQ